MVPAIRLRILTPSCRRRLIQEPGWSPNMSLWTWWPDTAMKGSSQTVDAQAFPQPPLKRGQAGFAHEQAHEHHRVRIRDSKFRYRCWP